MTNRCTCDSSSAVRVVHTFLCLAISGMLLWQDTGLRRALVELEDPVYGVLFLVLLVTSLVLYYLTCLTDPGYVNIQQYRKLPQSLRTVEEGTQHRGEGDHANPDSEEEAEEHTAMDCKLLDSKVKHRYCDYCEIEQPMRSKHCEDCDQCVRKYDHHCPYLGACIGERNHRYFWCFLLTTATLTVWTMCITWEGFVTKATWTDWFHANIGLFLVMAVLVIGGPILTGLLIFHTYLMVKGETTWEAASRHRITYLKGTL